MTLYRLPVIVQIGSKGDYFVITNTFAMVLNDQGEVIAFKGFMDGSVDVGSVDVTRGAYGDITEVSATTYPGEDYYRIVLE
ncbi:MAG: hypothetical protein WC551_08955 [Patescibacteria group bacterium]